MINQNANKRILSSISDDEDGRSDGKGSFFEEEKNSFDENQNGFQLGEDSLPIDDSEEDEDVLTNYEDHRLQVSGVPKNVPLSSKNAFLSK